MSTIRANATASTPMAGGLPLDERIAGQAADWLTLLMSGEMTEAQTRRWQAWRAEHPDHERAWRHIESVMGQLRVLEPKAAYENLSPYRREQKRSAKRRQLIHLVFLGGVLGGSGLAATRSDTWRQLTADHRTSKGEQQHVMLDDGTRVVLNTDSAVDVRFDVQRRQIRLLSGEIFVETAHALGALVDTRPLFVETAEGQVRALGTRFLVRQHKGQTLVAVLESAVEIQPWHLGGEVRVLPAGEHMAFTRDAFESPGPLSAGDQAWLREQIVAEDMRLDDFLAELQRYRKGFVRCAPEVAGLRFSGVFPLQDTDRILSALPKVLPVQVRQRTAYWVMVEPS